MRIARPLLVVLVAISVFAPVARAAPAPRHLGQTAVPGKEKGGCECTLAQLGDVGPTESSYLIPYDGVIVLSRLYVGEIIGAEDTFQVQTVDATGATTGTVASEGMTHSLVGSTANAVRGFDERVPARTGDVLAARFHDSPCLCSTSAWFETASEGDKVAKAGPLALGGSFSVAPVPKSRLNLEAVLEPDEDVDGYGDASQDLCPGSPIGATACSGALFGSNLQGERSTPPLACGGGGCMKVQKTLNGASTAAASNGVVVRWRVLNGEAGNYRARVLVPNAGATGGLFTGFTVLHSSAVGAVTAPSQPLFSKISTFETRLPIPVGGYVGLSVPSLADQGFQASGGAAVYVESNDGGDGLTVSGQSHNGTVLYDADIEPDVDGDGFGDVTQDACPAAASTQTAPCPLPPAMSGPPATTSTSAKPAIAGFKVTPKSFQIKHGGGTKLKLTLSRSAKVTFTLEQKLLCETKGKARCKAGFHALGSFSKSLPSGKSSVAFAGRVKGKNLIPGSYRVTAVAAAGGLKSAPARTMLTVLAPPTPAGK